MVSEISVIHSLYTPPYGSGDNFRAIPRRWYKQCGHIEIEIPLLGGQTAHNLYKRGFF